MAIRKPLTLVSGALAELASGDTLAISDIGLVAATASQDGYATSTQITKLDGIEAGANNYTHPSSDGSLHVPATSTTNNGKVLTAGASAGVFTWEDPATTYTHPTGDGNLHVPANSTTNSGKVLTASATAGTYTWETSVGGLNATAIKTSAYTIVANDLVRVDSAAGAFTLTLPSSPADGDKVGVFDIANKCGISPVLVAAAGGKTVEGDAVGLSVNIAGAYVYLIYNSTGTNWKIAETPSAAVTAFADGGNASSNYVYGQSMDGGTA